MIALFLAAVPEGFFSPNVDRAGEGTHGEFALKTKRIGLKLGHRVHCPHCPLGGHRAVRASPDAKMKHATFYALNCLLVKKPLHV
jgi:hypothetical protein